MFPRPGRARWPGWSGLWLRNDPCWTGASGAERSVAETRRRGLAKLTAPRVFSHDRPENIARCRLRIHHPFSPCSPSFLASIQSGGTIETVESSPDTNLEPVVSFSFAIIFGVHSSRLVFHFYLKYSEYIFEYFYHLDWYGIFCYRSDKIYVSGICIARFCVKDEFWNLADTARRMYGHSRVRSRREHEYSETKCFDVRTFYSEKNI